MAGQGELAEQVRAGLSVVVDNTKLKQSLVVEVPKSKLDEVTFGKPARQHVKEFAALFAVIFLFIGGWVALKNGSLATTGGWTVAALFMTVLGYLAPSVLYPVWSAWMKFAHILGLVMTFLILGLAWSIMLVPISLILKLTGKKVMDLAYGGAVESYWQDRDPKYDDFKLLERQY